MKNIIVISFLLTLFVRPVYQMGYLAYYEMNLEYIIDKYCVNKERPKLKCDGKCYLIQKLSAADDNSNNEDKRAPRLTVVFFPLFYQAISYDWQIHFKKHRALINVEIAMLYTAPFPHISLPPPKV